MLGILPTPVWPYSQSTVILWDSKIKYTQNQTITLKIKVSYVIFWIGGKTYLLMEDWSMVVIAKAVFIEVSWKLF